MTTTNPTSDEDTTGTRTLAVTDVDAALREALKKAADNNDRSVAAEARFRLRESFGLTKTDAAA